MKETIKNITEKLNQNPDIKFNVRNNQLTVTPNNKNGFVVTFLKLSNTLFEVSFDSWHEEFLTENDALNCFFLGLTSNCRLRVAKSGGKPFKWTLQYIENHEWKNDSTTGFLNLTFWKPKTIDYLQNDFMKWA